jgi:hypothetical protein
MRSQLLKDRLLGFEVVAAIGITILLRYGLPIYGFDVSWLWVGTFVLIPLLLFFVLNHWVDRKVELMKKDPNTDVRKTAEEVSKTIEEQKRVFF